MNQFKMLNHRLDALGSNPTQSQEQQLVDWIVENIGRDYWRAVMDDLIEMDHAYTLLSERCGECGMY